MAKRDVINYYKDTIKQYTKLTSTLKELQKAADAEQISVDQLENFMPLVEAAKAHVDEMSYVAFLLKKPLLNPKNFLTKHSDLVNIFKTRKLDRDSRLSSTQELIDAIRGILVDKEPLD